MLQCVAGMYRLPECMFSQCSHSYLLTLYGKNNISNVLSRVHLLELGVVAVLGKIPSGPVCCRRYCETIVTRLVCVTLLICGTHTRIAGRPLLVFSRNYSTLKTHDSLMCLRGATHAMCDICI